MVRIEDYDYDLPPELIAQEPASVRDQSRLLVLDQDTGAITHTSFAGLKTYLHAGDLLVVNDTRVFPARLIGWKSDTGGEVEVFLLNLRGDGSWDALTRPARRVRPGHRIVFGDGMLTGEVLTKGMEGQITILLTSELPLDQAIDRAGETPLPPYIRHKPEQNDHERYQTIYARERGAVAAPTAGLHFTRELLDGITAKGIRLASVTLHVGIGTFRPLTNEDIDRGSLHREYCVLPEETADAILSCRRNGGRVFAVGTTTARTLESASRSGAIEPFSGWTDLFIKPPYEFRCVDALITNFHLPRSSLLMLVAAFAGRERMFEAYRAAITERYRFYSYGDAMLILKGLR